MLAIKLALFAGALVLLTNPATARDMPVVDPSAIVAKYGKPDRSTSTEYDKPRPPMVTRIFDYKKENVRFVFLANAPAGSPPPYKSWLLMGTADIRENKVIPIAEAERRLQPRVRK